MSTNTLVNTTDQLQISHDSGTIKIFGFWIYLMSDCILFCCLFATYAVLMNNTAGGPTGRNIFELSSVMAETALLLLSSVTCGMMNNAIYENNKRQVILWLLLIWMFGTGFVATEFYEFYLLIIKGCGPDRSGFLSAFFSLVGAHSLHIISGLIWMMILMLQIANRGLTSTNRTRVICLSLFWHFLDIIWICVFSVVYLIGLCNG